MHKSSLISFLLASFFVFSLCSCSPIEDKISESFLDDNSLPQPLTAVDWTNKVNSLLLPILNDGETFLSHHLDIVKGRYSIDAELTMVESSLNEVQKAIEEINNINQPREYTQHKGDVLTHLKSYKNVLQQYCDALRNKNTDEIKKAADTLKNELAALKTVFRVR